MRLSRRPSGLARMPSHPREQLAAHRHRVVGRQMRLSDPARRLHASRQRQPQCLRPRCQPDSDALPRRRPERPYITGSYKAGGAVTCHAGSWTDATSYTIRMWKRSNTNPAIGTTRAVRLHRRLRRLSELLGHDHRSDDPDGDGLPSSDVARAATSLPMPCPTCRPSSRRPRAGGGVTPTTPAPPKDSTAPVVTRTSAVCGARACRIVLIVIDRGTGRDDRGLKSVQFTLWDRKRTTCKVNGKRAPA